MKKSLFFNEKRKISNQAQVVLAEEIIINNKHCVLVQNNKLELLFNIDNALDIVWVKYAGVNISFLSKNGLNEGKGSFLQNFEGGFLYTCGLDNVSSCVDGKPIHGSLHYQKTKNINISIQDESVIVCGDVFQTELFGTNLVMYRSFEINKNDIIINDVVENRHYVSADYVLLYHINYGYPFLDENLKLEIPAVNSEPLTQAAKEKQNEMYKITSPIDGGEENVYYHTLSKGEVRLANKNISVLMKYDINDFPYTLEWKSMISGDYALGIEPSLTRFDDFKMKTLKPHESKNYKIRINFKEKKL